jgi:hypothetical protein
MGNIGSHVDLTSGQSRTSSELNFAYAGGPSCVSGHEFIGRRLLVCFSAASGFSGSGQCADAGLPFLLPSMPTTCQHSMETKRVFTASEKPSSPVGSAARSYARRYPQSPGNAHVVATSS